MAYILQQRRDTLANWNSINPVLADAEIGFILDKDETTGKQKSSLYKIGDGRTAWKDLPLFGWGGNVYQDFAGSDLSTSLASREATLNKINEITQNAISLLNNELVNGTADIEGIINKLSKDQLTQYLSPVIGEVFGDITFNEDTNLDDIKDQLENQLVSRWTLIQEFNKVWSDLNALSDDYDGFVKATTSQLKTLQDFADEFGPSFTEFKNIVEPLVTAHTSDLDKHEKFIYGWDEEKEEIDPETSEPTIIIEHHDGIDDKFNNVNEQIESTNTKLEEFKTEVNSKHNILSEAQFAAIKDFSEYSEGTLFFTYKDQQ